ILLANAMRLVEDDVSSIIRASDNKENIKLTDAQIADVIQKIKSRDLIDKSSILSIFGENFVDPWGSSFAVEIVNNESVAVSSTGGPAIITNKPVKLKSR
ncbi:MAG: hypothetical protein U1B30_04330, partial [Pseudomonadota bacterium]|nr:hypothetical protein [Pseudomonadota bacterium]